MRERSRYCSEKKSLIFTPILIAIVVGLILFSPLIISENAMAAEADFSDAQVDNEASLNTALAGATGTAESPYVIEVTASLNISAAKTIASGKYVKLVSSEGSTVTLTRGTPTPDLFDVQGSLILENIVINGSGTTAKSTVRISSGATFTMEPGSVLQNANCTSTSGGSAVYNQGTFNLNGGSVKNNASQMATSVTGAIIYNSGTFTMTAGSITGNKALGTWGDSSVNGGVIYNTSGATFTMSGGVIGGSGSDENEAACSDWGGISGGVVYNAGTFTMNQNALIKGNKLSRVSSWPYASICGGAVFNSGTFTMSDNAEISGISANINYSNTYGLGVYTSGASARFTMQDNAKIKDNTGTTFEFNSNFKGGGVFNSGGSQFTMQGDVEISRNQLSSSTSSSSGAGVCNEGTGSTFTMKDTAKISNNTVSASGDCFGGGVYNYNGAGFILQGGAISGNSVTSTSNGCFGGGVYSYNNTTVTMSGGTITGNSLNASAAGSYCRGGGVFTSNATFNLSGGTISENQANNTNGYSEGGGVFNWNIFNMTGGRIIDNTAKNGGGVCNYTTFNLSGSAEITSNTAAAEGGGVKNNSGTFTMAGGSISGNTAPKGKGVLNAAAFNLSGGASIDPDNGVYLNSGKVISVTADLTGTSPLAIITPTAYSAGSNVVTLATGLSADAYASKFEIALSGTTPWGLKANAQNLQLAPGAIYLNGAAGLDTNDGSTKTTAVATFEQAKSLLGSPGTIYICGTVTIPSGNESSYTWTLPSGQSIKRYEDPVTSASDFTGIMIQLDGNLTLQNITIDGGWDEASGTGVEAVYPIIQENSTGDLTINAGAALQNNNIVIPSPDPSDRFAGSGVQGTGNVTVTGGKICGNQINILSGTANRAEGAGIGMDAGTLDISGGVISGNTLNAPIGFGAGIYVHDTVFGMSGGTVSGNVSCTSGGGAFVDTGSTFTMSGGSIGGSAASDANTALSGGGLFNFSTVNMTGGAILGNKTGTTYVSQGGGVTNQGSFTMSGAASITGNTSPYGGGVSNSMDFYISGSATIDGNTSTICGGGVYSSTSDLFQINGGSISNNTSDRGGGVYVNYGTADMTAGSITGNQATDSGGGIYDQASEPMSLSGGTISGNSAMMSGGGIVNNSILNMSGGTISANTAIVGGGGILNINILNMSGGCITGNTSPLGGGVCHVAGTFNLGGGALVARNNPVYLDTGTHITVTGALSNAPAAWVVPTAYPDFGESVKVAEANYTGATGATVLKALAAANSAYGLQASGNDVNLIKLKINPSITLGSASEAYTGSAIDYSGSVTKPADLNLTDMVFEYKLQTADDSAYTTTAPTNAGTYSVKATLTGHVKYNDTASNVTTFTINKATPVLSAFSDQQADYTGHDFAISAPDVTGVGGSDISDLGTISFAYKLQSSPDWIDGLPKNAGVYDVKAIYANANYEAGSVTNNVTIRKVALTATADDYSRSFGQPNPVFAITYSGFVTGEDASAITPPTASTTATSASNAGTYPITLSGGSAINYNITRVPGTLTIDVATPTITFADQSAAYNGKAFALSAPSVMENGVDLSVYGTLAYAYRLQTTSSWTDGLPKNAGVYDVRATFTGNANVSGGTAVNAITIRKAPLTASANNITKVVGTENPVLTIAYEGFVNNEGISALDTLPTASTTATTASTVGDYPITVSGGSAANYYFIYVPGTLTVSQLPGAQKPVFTKNLSGEYSYYNRVFNCNLKVAANVSDNGVITYQWYKNTERNTTEGSPIAGATGDSYTVPANTRGTVYYYVVAMNTLDANRTAFAASSIVKVKVNPISNTGDPSPEETQSPSPAISSLGPMPQETRIPSSIPNNQGNIAVEVLPATVDTPAVTVSDSTELKDFTLTQEDEIALQNGENITITLKVERVEGPVKQGDDDKVSGNMGGNRLGMYLNVELLKQIGEGQQQNVFNTSKPIRIVLAVPAELLKDGRNYSVIRVHGDETTVLPDLDNDPATVTIETDRFSTYALVYQDGPVLAFWMILLICILIVVLVIFLIYLAKRKKRGSATGVIF